MKKEYTFDRVEGDFAVLISQEDGAKTELPAEHLIEAGVPQGGILAAEYDENNILIIEYLAEKTEAAKESSRSRLSALFSRGKEDKQ